MSRVLVIAAGSNDKISFNTSHFGESRYFMIYEIHENGYVVFREMRINKAADMEEEMHGDPKKFKAVILQLEDVDVLLAYAMGPNFRRIVENSDKIPYIIRGVARKTKRIEDGLREILRVFEYIYEKVSTKRCRKDGY